MEKTFTEDDCVDSGAETGGSDYSPSSSTSSELSMGELQDPFHVSVHLITDPGQGKFSQRAADAVSAWVHPESQLFRVSERASTSQRPRPKRHQNGSPSSGSQPAMAVVLFSQEAYGGEEQISTSYRTLQRPPWRYHHTEKVSNGRSMLPLTPCSQDFFILSPGTPLWAVRQVHYGKEIVRFTVYCRHENYVDMVRSYKSSLQRRVAQKKEDFCFFVVYSNPDMEIQLSFKRLPRGQSPVVSDSAVMEVRVRDVGVSVPSSPHPCSPISDIRWQTEDYDGNKISSQGACSRNRQDPCYAAPAVGESVSAPSTFTRSVASYKNRRHQQRVTSHPRGHQASHNSLPSACEEQDEREEWSDQQHPDRRNSQWRAHQSGSHFSSPSSGSTSAYSTCSAPVPSSNLHKRSCSLKRRPSLVPPFRSNVDSSIGAEETDVDTGVKVNPGSSADSSVVSAYIKSSLPSTPRPSSAPPEDGRPNFSPEVPDNSYKSATSGRTPNSFNCSPSTLAGTRLQSSSLSTSAAPSSSDVSINSSDSCSIVSAPTGEAERVEEEQEFYI